MAVSAMISAAMGIARVVPEVAGWLGGDDAEATAEKVVETAKSVTGTDSAEAARQSLETHPEQLARVREALLAYRARVLAEETERLKSVNATMRKEVAADDAYVRRWRPTFGYVVALAWLAQMAGLVYSMVAAPGRAAALVEAVTAMTPLWGIALGVLGINVAKRSRDKEVAAGKEPAASVPAMLGRTLGAK